MKDKMKEVFQTKETWQLSDPGLDLGPGKIRAIKDILGTIDKK